jgi:hypothetical protein
MEILDQCNDSSPIGLLRFETREPPSIFGNVSFSAQPWFGQWRVLQLCYFEKIDCVRYLLDDM